MARSVRFAVALVLTLSAAPAILGHARIILTPVSAAFRCPGADCVSADAISGDGAGPYVGVAGDQQGAYFNGPSDLYFPLQPTYSRFVNLDFTSTVNGPAACSATRTCRRNFTTFLTNNSEPASLTNPIDAQGQELANGFLDIPVGGAAAARYKFNFLNANNTVRFTVRFNADAYPGTSNVTVTRTATNVWIVEARPSDVAELVSVPVSGRQTLVTEGFYSMPFRLTITK